MKCAGVLMDGFSRLPSAVQSAVDGLDESQLLWQADPEANSIAWLVWHLSRVQDDHLSNLTGHEQVWVAQDFVNRFGLPYPVENIGYGQSPDDVRAMRIASGKLLIDYYDAVHKMTCAFVEGISDTDLDTVVDKQWTPPVTMCVRLVSVINDVTQHVGQAAYLRGLIDRQS